MERAPASSYSYGGMTKKKSILQQQQQMLQVTSSLPSSGSSSTALTAAAPPTIINTNDDELSKVLADAIAEKDSETGMPPSVHIFSWNLIPHGGGTNVTQATKCPSLEADPR